MAGDIVSNLYRGYKLCFSKSGNQRWGGNQMNSLKETARGDAVSVPVQIAEKKVNVCSRAEPSVSGG